MAGVADAVIIEEINCIGLVISNFNSLQFSCHYIENLLGFSYFIYLQ